ncbi:MAG: Ig-like domain-containing protein, partial [Pirellulaceae bacterium]
MSKRQKRLKRRKHVQLSAETRRDSLRRHLIETLETRQLLTTFSVTSLADRPDASPGDGRALDVYGNTTLRSAISEANALGGSHTINLPAGNYQIARAGRGDNTNCVGDLDIRSEITILGAGAGKTTIDGNGLDRVFHLVPDTGATLNLKNLTVTGGETRTTIDNRGGGILNDGGTLRLDSVQLTDNFAGQLGGGLFNDHGGQSLIVNSSITDNQASYSGGGLDNHSGSLEIHNSTISGNRAARNAGIVGSGSLSLTHVTVVDNVATSAADPDVYHAYDSDFQMNHSIVGTIKGAVISGGHNLVMNGDGSTGLTNGQNGDQVGTSSAPIDARLGPLAGNGGPTLTHAPNAASPALDAGSFKNAPDADQRGVSRPSEGDQRGQDRIDIGSVEVANQSPVAANDAYEINENKVLNVNTAAASILANDSDPDGDALTAVIVKTVEHGSLQIKDDGTFTYTPEEGYHGKDSFTYVAHDRRYQSEIATVTFEVICTNEAPVAVNDSYQLDTRNDIAAQKTVLANDTDPDGDALSAVLVSSPEHGALTFNENGTFTYTPKEGYRGNDSFTYTAFDGTDSSNVATVSIEVICSNAAPVAVNDSYSVDENSTLKTEQDSYTQRFDLRSEYGNTPYRISNASLLRESFSPFVYYWHPSQLNQWAEVVYKVDVPFSIESADSLKVGQHHPGLVSVYNGHSDANFDPNARGFFEVSLDDETWHTIYESTPEEGVKQRNEIGDILQGATSFFVRGRLNASRRLGCCGLSQFLRSAPENNSSDSWAPVPQITLYGNESILANDSDPDGDSLSAKLVSKPENGDLKLNDDGSFTYTPDEGFHGADSFTYTAFDGMANSNVAT